MRNMQRTMLAIYIFETASSVLKLHQWNKLCPIGSFRI